MMKDHIPKMESNKIGEDSIIGFRTSPLSPPIIVPNSTTYGCFGPITPKFLKDLALTNFRIFGNFTFME
jgi:hypothetical protein